MQCAGEFPLLKDLKARYGAQRLAVVGVSVDRDCEKTRETVEHRGLDWAQTCDGKVLGGDIARLYNVEATPTYYVLDPQGRIAGKKVDAGALDELVREGLSQGAPAGGGPHGEPR